MLTRDEVAAMSAKGLKEALAHAQVDFSDCFEKSDLVKKMVKHLAEENDDAVQRKKCYANSAFSRGSFSLAVRYYSDSLAMLGEGGDDLLAAQLHSNKSLTLLRMNLVSAALSDARKCVRRSPSFAKGWLRLGSALSRLGMHGEAVGALRRGVEVLDAGGAPPDDRVRLEMQEKLSSEADVCAARGEPVPDGGSVDWGEAELPPDRPPEYRGSALLEMLGDDVLAALLGGFLEAPDVCRVAATCRHLRGVCVLRASAQEMWHAVCSRTWPGHSERYAADERDWISFCRERRSIDEAWVRRFECASVHVFKHEQAPVFNVHRQGDMLASAEDNCVKLWDIPRRRLDKRLDTGSNGSSMVLGVWLHPSQQKCLSGAADGDIKVWNVKAGAVERVCAGHSGPVVTIYADDAAIYSTSFDSTCRVWNWQGRNTRTLLGHQGHVCGLSPQPGEPGTVWTGADDGIVKRWDVESGACTVNLDPAERLETQPGSVWCVQAGQGVLVSASTDAWVRVWDPRSGREVATLDGHVAAVAGLRYDDDKVVTCAFDGTVRLWDWRTYRSRGVLHMARAQGGPQAYLGRRRCTRLAVDDGNILVGCIDGSIYQIDVF